MWRAKDTLLLVALALVIGLALGSGSALAAEPGQPYWKVESRPAPTHLPLENEGPVGEAVQKGEGGIIAVATNLGATAVHGSPIVLSDHLPAKVVAVNALGLAGKGVPGQHGLAVKKPCQILEAGKTAPEGREVRCEFTTEEVSALPPFDDVEARIRVKVHATTPESPANEVSVSGGNAPPKTLSRPMQIGGGAPTFGLENFELTPENEDGSIDTQAGSHPFQLTTTFALNQGYGADDQDPSHTPIPQALALQREIVTKVPAGLLGDPLAVPRCTGVDFGALDEKDVNSCADNTAVGVAVVTFNDPILEGLQTYAVPIFNLEPQPGSAARFGFEVIHVPVVLDASVRTGGDYGVNVTVRNTSEAVQVLAAQVTLWGNPSSPAHDEARGWDCLGTGNWEENAIPPHSCPHESRPQIPFLFLPTSCPTSAQTIGVSGRSWPPSGDPTSPPATFSAEAPFPTMTGCSELPFSPSIAVKPDESSASTPTGLNVDVNMPQETTLNPSGRAESDLQATTLALPQGLQASAGAANGLETCSTEQVGFNEGGGLGASLEAQQFNAAGPACPNAAKIGTVNIKTPVLEHELLGSVYLGSQNTNPFASPLVLYLVAEEETTKVLIKLAGEVAINPATGQLTSSFKNTPQAPFERLHLHLFNGSRASQATPGHCGSYAASGVFTPWSGQPAANAGSGAGEGFQITSGPGGGPCPGATLPLAPSLAAGSTNPAAGAFSPFSLTLSRPDGQQGISGLSAHLPPGIAAVLKNVTPCPIPAPGQPWSCGPASLVGHSTASSGLGGAPVTLGGTVYLTQGYDGAPFGLLDETLAKAGPFNLGVVDVLSRINVDPTTAAVTVTTDPGPHGDALPTILKGVPVQLKQINVTTDRPEFQFNPTNCTPKTITATVTGDEGGSGSAANNYNVTGCAALPFHPGFTISSESTFSRSEGLGMKIVVTSSKGQANIGKTKVMFPKALPSRLTTIQKACDDKIFNANPANCPEGSVIGLATAHTPVLRVPLTGPAYLVSHANASFPDAEFVLQGEGIKLVLDGKTDIKNGVTSSTFETVPDAPVETFEVNLPKGPHSAFSGFGNLCENPLNAPTEMVGQNGRLININTVVKLNGCVLAHHTESELAKLLKQCRKVKNHKVRVKCEATARKRAAAVTACKKKNKSSKKKRLACEAQARRKYVLKFK